MLYIGQTLVIKKINTSLLINVLVYKVENKKGIHCFCVLNI